MKRLLITNSITNKKTTSIDKYLLELNKIKVLSKQEELDLIDRYYNKKEEEAKDKIIKHNLRFVVSVAKKYQNNSFNILLDDLISQGNLGLIKAIKTFDPSKNYKFISYAVWWIRQSILLYLTEKNSLIRNASNSVISYNKIKKFSDSFYVEYNREPTDDELLEKFSESIVNNYKNLVHNSSILSLSPQNQHEDEIHLIDTIKNENAENFEDNIIKNDMKNIIYKHINKLNENEKIVICKSFGINEEIPLPIEDIAKIINNTKENTFKIKQNALKKLKIKFKNESNFLYY